MKVLVEIDEIDFENLKRKDKIDRKFLTYYEKLIANGTPLPKGHGDLIDREELKNKYAGWYNLATDKSIHAVLISELYYIEPVIQADGGDAE